MLFYMHILFCVTLSCFLYKSPLRTESFHLRLETAAQCYIGHHAPSCCDAVSCIVYDGYGSLLITGTIALHLQDLQSQNLHIT